VETASRNSKYPGLINGATISSANASAYPGRDHCRTQRGTGLTRPGSF
jgi:hypothetical protein